MAHDNPDQPQHATQEHETMLQRITARYIEAYDRGEQPSLEDYIRRYPDYAVDLLEFAFFYHGFAADVPIDAPATGTRPVLSASARSALRRIHEMEAAGAAPEEVPLAAASRVREPAPSLHANLSPSGAAIPPITGILAEAATRKLSPKKLAALVAVTSEVLAKLDARAISVTSIPGAFLRRLAEALEVPTGSIRAYLAGASGPAPVAGLYLAESAPEQRQETFLQAIETSSLSADEKQTWREAAEAEGLA